MKAKTFVLLAAIVATLAAAPAVAQVQDRDRDRMHDMDLDRLRDRDRIYGYDLMTIEEHEELFRRLEEAESDRERTRIMHEHRQAMQERVRAVLGMIGGGRGPGGGQGAGGQGGRGN
jgi:Spy/CpxP family protein refolding chaperone